jgi:hypothetical protein
MVGPRVFISPRQPRRLSALHCHRAMVTATMIDPYQPPRERDQPSIPTPGSLSRGPLWILLLAPPLFVVIANLVIGWGGYQDTYGVGFLRSLGIGLVALVVCQICFPFFVRQRYRGKSVMLLSMAYFVGEVVIGLAVWFGSCLLLGYH